MDEVFNPYNSFNKALLGSTQVANIAGISSRQLRYWEQQGYIQSAPQKANNARQYSVNTTLKIIIIAHYNHKGINLKKAVSIADDMLIQARAIGQLITLGYQGFEQHSSSTNLFLGPVANQPEKQIVSIIQNNKVSFKLDNKVKEYH
ncbi:MerR family DNA-binding transcriptional regulator [Levilactobacillus brevis]|uniref:MerR family DNA-binding transcriptional regulator n=1 Tax=Levilactobacillus brevis TaxID=1580 RepID=UPI0020CE0A47|nr:MerR family DNA-binding transcriptional regulator [Levilactobacillus brevis]MCP9613182.1 MerR family DNA-binding transcriptional regulator [Levilactobacillus brevis]